MSSSSGPVAAHNLVFADGVVRLECAATGAVIAQRAPGDDPASIGEALRALAPRCGGPVAAVLPAAAFSVTLAGPGPVSGLAARLVFARKAGAAAVPSVFGLGEGALALAVGPADRRGRAAAVAVERRVLAEVRTYLGEHGFAVAAVRPDPALAPGRALPAFQLAPEEPARQVRPAVARVRAVAGAWMAGAQTWSNGRAALAAGAAALILVAAISWSAREASAPGALVADLPVTPELDAVEADGGLLSGIAIAPEQPAAPESRTLPDRAVLAAEPPRRRPEAPAPLAGSPMAVEGAALATIASRSVPAEIVEDARRAAAVAQARAEMPRLAAISPQPRPETAPPRSAVEAGGTSAAGATPRPRPAETAPAATPSAAASADVAGPAAGGAPVADAAAEGSGGLRPTPRPPSAADEVERAVAAALEAGPVRVAALDGSAGAAPSSATGNATGAAAGLAAAAAAGPRPLPRQERAAQAAPAAQAAQVRPAQAAPARMAALPAQPAPAVAPPAQAPAAAQPQRAAPQPAQPQRQAARTPQPQPQVQRPAQQQPQAQRPAQQQPQRQQAPAAGGGGAISLIGVFGASSQRHALVRLPNGSVQRVRPGETVAGAQVAAVGSDNVRLRVNGADRVLRLPD